MAITQKQLRRIIKEEMEQMEGYHEMTSEEKEELEEGVMDFLRGAKASAAGGLAGAGAAIRGAGSAVAGGVRGAVAGAKGGATGVSQPTVKGVTKFDAATIAGLTKAQSLVNSYLKQIQGAQATLNKVKDNALSQIGNTKFGKVETAGFKEKLAKILTGGNPADLQKLNAQLEKAKAGDPTVLAALSLTAKGAGDVGQQAGGKTVKFGDGKREIRRGEEAAPEAGAAGAAGTEMAAEEMLAEAVIRKIANMNKKASSK